MKLIATLGMAALLSGCSMFDSQQSAIPAEFAGLITNFPIKMQKNGRLQVSK